MLDFIPSLGALSEFLNQPDEQPEASREETRLPRTGNTIIDFLLEKVESLLPDQRERIRETRETAEEERSSIFGEVWESILARYFPGISKILDLSSMVGLTEHDAEEFPWQNEIESLTAFSVFLPDGMLRKLTDPLAKSELFLKILDSWPLGSDFAEKIRAEKDPDDVIDALRMMHQDLITGKVGSSQILQIIF